jgi:DNA-binding beta-propeller fold protein YncE
MTRATVHTSLDHARRGGAGGRFVCDGLARVFSGGVLIVAAAWLAGCSSQPGPIFTERAEPIEWPAAPEPARIRYVGELVTDADLRPVRSFGQSMGEMLFGGKPRQSMLTPYAVCGDDLGRVFVADSNAQTVHVFDLNQRTYTRWQPPTDGPETPRFSQPIGLAWDPSGRLIVSDSMAGILFVFNREGELIDRWGAGVLSRPCGVAIDPQRDRLYVADAGLHQVLVLDLKGQLIRRIGARGTALGQFNFPTHVTVDSVGRLYVSDTLNFRVQQFDTDLKPIRQIGQKGDLPGYFSHPKGVAVDAEDHLYVVDAQFESIQVFDPEGLLLMQFGEEGHGEGEFWIPTGIYIDQSQRLWIADSYNRRLQVFQYLPEPEQ